MRMGCLRPVCDDGVESPQSTVYGQPAIDDLSEDVRVDVPSAKRHHHFLAAQHLPDRAFVSFEHKETGFDLN